MKPAKKRSKKGEIKSQASPQIPLATIIEQMRTDEPAVATRVASEPLVHQQRDTPKKDFKEPTPVEVCTKATLPEEKLADEPAATTRTASEVPVNKQSDTPKKDSKELPHVESCPITTIPEKEITDEPAAIPRVASEQPVNQQSDHPKKGLLGLTPFELCTLVISGTTLLCVVILSWVISGKLNQIGGAEQTDKMIAQASRISSALEESLKQGRAALDSSISASHLDQRAWVGVKSIQLFPMEAGKPLKMELKISNSGKTFALDLKQTALLNLSLTPLDDVADADKASLANQPRQVPTLATISPNGESLIPCTTLAPISEEMINSINTGKLHIYLAGEINYTDVFKHWHVTRFFQHYVPGEQKFMAGPTHNDAD